MADETINCGDYSIFRTEKSGEIWQFRCIRPGGRKIRASCKTEDQTRAKAIAARKFADILDLEGSPIPAVVAVEAAKAPRERAAVAKVAVDFLVDLKTKSATKRSGFYKGHDSRMKKYVLHLWEWIDEIDFSTSPTDKDEPKCEHFLDKILPLARTQKNPDGLTWATLQKVVVTTRMFYAYAMKHGHVPAIQLPRLRSCLPDDFSALVEEQEAKRRALSEAERDALLGALEAYDPQGNQATLPRGTAFRFYVVLFWSLLRRGELWALTPRWVDFDAKQITIPAEHTKSRKQESIPLHPKVEAALLAEIEARGKKEEPEFYDLPIFGEIDVRKAWAFALETARVNGKRIDRKGLVPHHVTRHSAATWAGKSPKSSLIAMQALGRWRSPKMVGRYMHPEAEMARSILESLT